MPALSQVMRRTVCGHDRMSMPHVAPNRERQTYRYPRGQGSIRSLRKRIGNSNGCCCCCCRNGSLVSETMRRNEIELRVREKLAAKHSRVKGGPRLVASGRWRQMHRARHREEGRGPHKEEEEEEEEEARVGRKATGGRV
ncbi:hypothetical protein Mp_3g05680 [Marchantia polymorpha subsp. ruderalis]|uniref:Uncharacterized protein n=2 Tax=Marchantia polymorpha TaxID=3197 RepID=A0AAF6AXS2_MARPO|nr:hypothetical protein MARPO_0006s0039 [Marchantia polymorpha]BBN04556.1 hypothetical protein Mp_3g05680 [Marchantia polymorpha subsp. ruderalis]|eukprot:PTQ47994.1 hypothetical protein MARPO_0006s0039 [Marchantia polymorpha]